MKAESSPRLLQRGPAEEILDHFVSGDTWRVPTTIRVEVIGVRRPRPMLIWSGEPPFLEVHAGPGLLEDFLKLERAKDDDAILRYARRWGPLWLCRHNLPSRHVQGCGTPHGVQHRNGDPGQPIEWWEEEIASWRTVSREGGSVVRIARQLHNGQFGRHDDWESLTYLPRVMFDVLYSAPPDPFIDPADFSPEGRRHDDLIMNDEFLKRDDIDEEDDDIEPATPRRRRLVELLGRCRLQESVEFQRYVLSGVLNYWLQVAGVQPRLNWPGAKPAVHLAGQGLFAALAVQLLFECSRTDGLAVCTSCGTPFLPQARRPRRDHNPYCSDCGLKAAQRDAAARYRQTKKYRATYDMWLQKRRRPST
jgi:hypothetical protein